MLKRCKLCGGEPKWIYYAMPEQDNPEGWDFTGDDGELEPMILFKRLECKECKATNVQIAMTIDGAEKMWNEGKVLQYWMDETTYDVEPKSTEEV